MDISRQKLCQLLLNQLNNTHVRGVQKEFRVFEVVPLEIYSVKMGKNKLNVKVNKINKAFQCLNGFQFELHLLLRLVEFKKVFYFWISLLFLARRTIITGNNLSEHALSVSFSSNMEKTFTKKSLTCKLYARQCPPHHHLADCNTLYYRFPNGWIDI